jgi:hypothetical protein
MTELTGIAACAEERLAARDHGPPDPRADEEHDEIRDPATCPEVPLAACDRAQIVHRDGRDLQTSGDQTRQRHVDPGREIRRRANHTRSGVNLPGHSDTYRQALGAGFGEALVGQRRDRRDDDFDATLDLGSCAALREDAAVAIHSPDVNFRAPEVDADACTP